MQANRMRPASQSQNSDSSSNSSIEKKAIGFPTMKITLCVFAQLIALSSAKPGCLYKCKDFTDTEICIVNEDLCDHFPQCADGEDEENCGCEGFTCEDSGMCIKSSEECNGFPNCFDRSDESNCTKLDYKRRFPSLPEQDLCKKPCGRRGSCSFASNGNAVCQCDVGYSGTFCETEDTVMPTASQTSQTGKLLEETFACDRTEISKKLFCDGTFDCADKSDEANCTIEDYRKAKPHIDRRFLCLMPCERTDCTFDESFKAVCPCPEKSEGLFCENVVQTFLELPQTTPATPANVTSHREKSNNFFTTVALPLISIAGLALALWLVIAKPWATGGTLGRQLV